MGNLNQCSQAMYYNNPPLWYHRNTLMQLRSPSNRRILLLGMGNLAMGRRNIPIFLGTCNNQFPPPAIRDTLHILLRFHSNSRLSMAKRRPSQHINNNNSRNNNSNNMCSRRLKSKVAMGTRPAPEGMLPSLRPIGWLLPLILELVLGKLPLRTSPSNNKLRIHCKRDRMPQQNNNISPG